MSVIWLSAYHTGPSVYLTPPDTAVPPLVVPIATGPLDLPRGAHRDFPFVLPSHLCRVTGQVTVTPGGESEAHADPQGYTLLLFNDSTYARFRAGKPATPAGDSGAAPGPRVDLLVIGPGRYHLFIAAEPGAPARSPAPVKLEARATCP